MPTKKTRLARSRPPKRTPRDGFHVELVPIAQVKPYPGNPRKPGKAIDKVATSIQRYGWQQPIVVDEAGVILAGHTRFAAAQRLRMDRVPIHRAVGLSPQQARAYRIADNRTGAEAVWDDALLVRELKAIEGSGDLHSLGFEDSEIERILKRESNNSDASPKLPEGLEFRIIIDCEGEAHQRELIERFEGNDLKCRALIS